MQTAFTDLEGLRIAVEMEKRGEDFYRRSAKVSKSKETVSLLGKLADDEVVHAREFERLYDRTLQTHENAAEEHYDEETSAYLNAVAADIVFSSGLMALRRTGFENPAAVLEYAIHSEKDSILFYSELAGCAKSAQCRETFLEIARQERGHLARLVGRLNQIRDTERG